MEIQPGPQSFGGPGSPPTRYIVDRKQRVAVPTHMPVTVTGDDLPFDLELVVEPDSNDVLGCRHLIVNAREGGPSITSARLGRLPIREIVETATEMCAVYFDEETSQVVASSENPALIVTGLTRAQRRGRGQLAIRDEELPEVARVVRERNGGKNRAVRDAFSVSRATADRAIDRAIKAGFLEGR